MYPQRLLHDSSHIPYIEILHAVIILAWSEYKAGRVAGPTEYSQVRLPFLSPLILRDFRAVRLINLLGSVFADGHQAGDEPRARKRRYWPECERAYTASFHLVVCCTTPTNCRLSRLTTKFPPLFRLPPSFPLHKVRMGSA
jgi:hypothetical protein